MKWAGLIQRVRFPEVGFGRIVIYDVRLPSFFEDSTICPNLFFDALSFNQNFQNKDCQQKNIREGRVSRLPFSSSAISLCWFKVLASKNVVYQVVILVMWRCFKGFQQVPFQGFVRFWALFSYLQSFYLDSASIAVQLDYCSFLQFSRSKNKLSTCRMIEASFTQRCEWWEF